jgi:L-ascorbate metabolism protein UlaG (beta-lactamase superfamily)
MLRAALLCLSVAGSLMTSMSSASAQARMVSQCLAIAQTLPGIMFASYSPAADKNSVTITYVGHSTYQIETPGDVVIATDYNGVYRPPRLPTLVTMNRAHSTHYTLNPDPRIQHVLHGWSDDGAPARHEVTVGDVLVRNVTTDIRNFRFGFDASSAMQKDGNSIFIFEVAGLCIGHLGHLHHKLDESHIAAIGRLDIVMVPIDDSVTMSLDGMADLTKRLRSSIVLPMHRLGTPLRDFVQRAGAQFEVDMKPGPSFSVSLDTLPKTPTIVVLEGV